MRAYVFSDAALAKHAGRFVWLEINTEAPQNAAFLARHPVDAWPTLMVIDPRTDEVALKWLGSADVSELGELLADGANALAPAHADRASALRVRADRAEARGDHAGAAKLYRQALAQGGPSWADAPRVEQSLVFALQEAGDLAGCARFARERAPALGVHAAYANLVATGLQCALDLPAPSRREVVERLVALNEAALKFPDLLADDRSGVYETLVSAREAAGDTAGEKKLAAAWLAFLEGQAAKAKSPAERAAFDPHRVEAAIALGDPARALPALQQSERDLPDDYNAPAREAIVYLALGKLDAALAANDRALAKVYGPRALRVLENRADILQRMKRIPEARQALEHALALSEKLPASQRPVRDVAEIHKQLAALPP